jgi:hypothetical protein
MNDDELRQLVREADRGIGVSEPPRVTGDGLLAAAQRRRRARSAQRRATAAALVAGVMLAGALMASQRGRESIATGGPTKLQSVPVAKDSRPRAEALASGGPNSRADWSLKRPVRSADAARDREAGAVEELRQELARLEREAAMHQQIVAALLAPDNDELEAQLAAVMHDSSGLRGAELLRQETARSAAISLQYATIVEREFEDAEAARREYERVAERFPGTTWADLAVVSLERLSAAEVDPFSL